MNELRKYKKLIFLVATVIMIGVILFLKKTPAPLELEEQSVESQTQITEEMTSIEKVSSSQENADGPYYVDIKGAVKKPGMYAFTKNDRVYDGIKKAGGLTKEAADEKIDFAQKLEDQMTVIIPKKGEKIKEVIRQPKEVENNNSDVANTTEAHGKININTATKEQLQTISGIGEKRAQDIIDYRQKQGSFKSLDDLNKVTGIGPKTLAKLKESLCL